MIDIAGLTKRFGRRAVLDALSLSIAETDRVALVGSNGAGKTTLIRCLLGEYRFQGEIRVDGRALKDRDPVTLGRIAFVPQAPPPLRMPVRTLADYASATGGAAPARIAELSNALGFDMAAHRDTAFTRLSGGQKQKLMVAIALARPETRLFVFDEPAANLDPSARRVFLDLLAERRDAAMLIASHRIEEIAGLVNRVIELDHGRVALDDRVADLLEADDLRQCRIALAAPEPTFGAQLVEWGFVAEEGGRIYRGAIAGGDAFRFYAMIARYAAVIDELEVGADASKPIRENVHVQAV